jgi:amidophosphoribosyltransferase
LALGEKCAVFGVYGHQIEAARLAYYGLWALQHRGQESSGIVSSDGQRLYSHTNSGLVAQAYGDEDLDYLRGSIAIGHNRYSTSGGAHDMHAQPILSPEKDFALAHNGNLPSTRALEAFLTTHQVDWTEHNDSEKMVLAIAYYTSTGLDLPQAIKQAWPLFTGAFACTIMSRDQLIAIRDSKGIRPLSIGQRDDSMVIASETCAFDTIGAAFLRDVRPGEMVVINHSGVQSQQIEPGEQKLDIFEYVYFARPDSLLLGQRVNEVRRRLGINLAAEANVQAEVVIPVPDSAIPAAIGYASATQTPFDHGLIKNRYIHRTFIRPAQSMRERDLKMKLNPLAEVIMGKDVAVVDDSIVRGTTIKRIVHMLYGAGARKVHLLISSPPVKYPDFYGIDTPTQANLIAANLTTEQIRRQVGCDTLTYLSYDGMIKATRLPVSKFSTSCFDGVYPLDIAERAAEVASV